MSKHTIHRAEAYSESIKTSNMELLVKIFIDFQSMTVSAKASP